MLHLMLAQAFSLEGFGLKELGVIGLLIGALFFTVRHLYMENQRLHALLIETEKSYQTKVLELIKEGQVREDARTKQDEEIAIATKKVLWEVLMYLKFVHAERAEHYEQLNTGQGVSK